MTVDEAVAWLRGGGTLLAIVGTGPEDPRLIVRNEDGGIVSESIAGWSAGVTEPVCAADSNFLLSFLAGKELRRYTPTIHDDVRLVCGLMRDADEDVREQAGRIIDYFGLDRAAVWGEH